MVVDEDLADERFVGVKGCEVSINYSHRTLLSSLDEISVSLVYVSISLEALE